LALQFICICIPNVNQTVWLTN